MNPIKLMFTAEDATANAWDAIRWWKLRRIPYNFLVGITGLISVVVMEVAGEKIIRPGEDFEEPLGLIIGILLFGIGANIFYTFGWLLEIRMKALGMEDHRTFRKRNFREGLALSCALATLPIWLALLALILHGSK